MKEKILVIEDDEDILNLISYQLEAHQFIVRRAQSGQEGFEIAWNERPDLIILDIMLPDMDGFEVCKRLKRHDETTHIPVIMLTAKGEEIDRVLGFELGADDYVVKPFSPRELILRIKAILRRKQSLSEDQNLWQREGMVFNIEAHSLAIDGVAVPLTATEFNLLLAFVRNEGRVLTREILLDRVWGYNFEGYARTVDTHIRRLRKKLGAYGDWIQTVRGFGYKFETNTRSNK
ncbi:MAG: response regulator transcription factor [Syntrophobacterales bacterium]|nr:response regulator transcription factor [Syntrophobacterales bacterium]